ncbi:hypothetical protein H5P28_11815 [Ruficoccus amylovorans]|uniref:Uncharacterized protein n=1 Tax=Ruficoccus amylovorans TaxID=1804625 RepID=A0A842HHA3_9BACT|nr:hypothetical protein [Ruficoccus amylovorans]MBC2594944.1 hypothetical protein [Ruficoccus amylovorans]
MSNRRILTNGVRLKPSDFSPQERHAHLAALQTHPGWEIFVAEYEDALRAMSEKALGIDLETERRERMVTAYHEAKTTFHPEAIVRTGIKVAETERNRLRQASLD